MAQIRIRIGATKDRSVDAVFSQIEERSAQAAVRIRRNLAGAFNGVGSGAGGAGGGGGGGGGGKSPRLSQEERDAKRIADTRIREERRAAKEAERLLKQRQSLQNRHYQQEARERQRMERRENLDAQRERRLFAERTSHRATRFLTPNAPIGSIATRAMGDFARGAGVDFSIAGSVSRGVSLERAAIDLSNSGYQAKGTGPNAQRVDPRALVSQARGVADKYGLDAGDALGGLSQFQKITGDLDTGRKMLDDMAKLSAATGTNISDMAAAAANVSNNLGDIPNKSQVVDKVMRTIAGQGKLGAVEISDMAVQMSRIAAAATQFGGDASSNIEKMSALAQISRQTGGTSSAADAARSVVGFANTLKKSARIKEFEAVGVKVFSDKGNTNFRDPTQIIKDSLVATGGDRNKMNKLFMDVIGARGMEGLLKAFNKDGGGEEGLKAVDMELRKFTEGATLSQEEINESAKRASESAAAKAARFQNRLDEISQKVADDLIPAMEKVAPLFLKFASVLGSIASWSVENPGQAIVLAITASIARAGLESALRTGIERLLTGGAGGRGAYDRSAGFGGGLGVLGNATAALNIASLGIASFYVGKAIIDQMVDNSREEKNKAIGDDVGNELLAGQVAELIRAGKLKEALDLQTKKRDQDATDVEKTKDTSFLGEFFKVAINSLGGASGAGPFKEWAEAQQTEKATNKALLDAQTAELKQSNAKLAEIATLLAQNPPGGAGPVPGRQPLPVPGQ